MNSEAEMAAIPEASHPVVGDRTATGSRQLGLDIALVFVLTGFIIGVPLAVNAWTRGAIQQRYGLTFLSGTLMFFLPLLACVLLERVLPAAGPRKSLKRSLLHLQINVCYLIALTVGGILGGLIAAALSRHFGLGLIDFRFASGKGVLGLIGAFLLSVLVRDFFFYWYHRSLHRIPFLWQLHKLHHMDRELDVLTAARENWIDPFLEALLVALPVTLLFKLDNTSPLIIGAIPGFIIGFLHGNQGTFIHLNLKLRLGWASALWCGPQVHRIHHSRLPQHRDKNFAAAFPLWDILFRTYYAPARDEFPPTGVDGEQEIQHLVEAQIFTLREWRKMFRARRRRTAILA